MLSSSFTGALFLCPKIKMPYRSKKPCSYPGCPELVDAGNTYCRKHLKKYFEGDRQKRGTASSRGYSSRWRRVSRLYLKKNPLCAECLKEGRVVPAEVVDHIVPHRGDYNLFWDFRELIGHQVDMVWGDNNITDREPIFREGSYRLREGSPGIDAGRPDLLDKDGSRSDIGVYGGPAAY